MNVVFSTLATSQGYPLYPKITKETPQGPIMPLEVVYIKGGAGIADKNLITPRGVATQVTDHQLEIMEQDEVFKLHVKNGFIKVEAKDRKIEKAVYGMAPRDKSGPKLPEDYVDKALKPRTNLHSVNSMGR